MTGAWLPVVLAGVSASLVLTAWLRRADGHVLLVERVCGPSRGASRERASSNRAPSPREHAGRLLRTRSDHRRQAAIDRQALDFVELLLAATEAGLPPAIAVERSAAMTSGFLGEELLVAARQIALGLGWRAALEQVVARTGSPALRRLTRSLARAHRLGTSPRQSLRSIAHELRLERRARAEEIARRAPVKMLFPLVLLILPAFLLLTVGPVLLATIQSLR
jgi:pilus assembly protein TadC